MSTFWNVLLVIFVVVVVVLGGLYFLGIRLEKKQVQQQALLEAAAQTVSILVIDKKKMKLNEASLPKAVMEQTPKYLRRMKVPVVKAKIGTRVMTLLADGDVFKILPLKTEARVVISGIYITQVKSIRGSSVPVIPKKKGILERIGIKKKDKKDDANADKKKK